MAKILYLIRHGATVGSGLMRYKGSMDVPLSEKGIRQMQEVATYLYHKIAQVGDRHLYLYSSPLSRALKSAEIIGEKLGIRPVIMEEFRERNFGLWEGMTFDEIMNSYPQEFEAWKRDPLKYSPPQGESTLQVRERVIKGLKGIYKGNLNHLTDYSIILVAHGGVNRIILCELLGIPLENIFRIEQGYGCLNVTEFYDDYPLKERAPLEFPGLPVVKLLNFTINDLTVMD